MEVFTKQAILSTIMVDSGTLWWKVGDKNVHG